MHQPLVFMSFMGWFLLYSFEPIGSSSAEKPMELWTTRPLGWKASRCWAARECGRHDCTSAGLLFSWVLILGWVLSAGNPNILSEKKPDEPCTQEHSLPTYEISLYSTHSLNTYESSSIWSLQSQWKWGWFEVNSNGFFFGFQEFCECQWCPSCFESTKIWSYEFLIFSNDRTETGFSWEFRSWASWWFQFLYHFHHYK